MDLMTSLRNAWGWTGLDPDQIAAENQFGNLLIKDRLGHYWRLCPEDLVCEVVAASREELDVLFTDPDFLNDWQMSALVEQAEKTLGPLLPGRKYCLKVPGVLGGEYGGDNLGIIAISELIEFSGHVAKQIAGLPEGAQVKFSFV